MVRQSFFIIIVTALTPVYALAVGTMHTSAPVLQTSAVEKPDNDQFAGPWKYNWNIRVAGLGVSDDTEESRVAGVNLLGGLTRKFNDYIDTGLAIRARFESGSTHSLYEINRVQNGAFLDEAYINLHPVPDYTTLAVGSLNQRFIANPLLIDELSFPGVQERIHYKNSKFNAGLVFEQAIPISTSLSTRTSEKEPLPSLFVEGVFVGVTPTDRFAVNARGGHFQFNDLPSQVAFDSFSQGNIVDADVPQDSQFRYGFQGLFYGGDLAVRPVRRWEIKAGADAFVNTDAPSEYSHGLLTFVQTSMGMGGGWALIPRWEYFENERHSSPAYYNSADYGHNNRQGFSYEVKILNQRQGLALKGRYTDSVLIEDDPLQANTKIFMLYLELFDAI